MFKNLTIANVLAIIAFLLLWIFNEFETAFLLNAMAYVSPAILCGKLADMDEEIKSIKTHLGIKGNASINKGSSNDIMKHDPNNNDY